VTWLVAPLRPFCAALFPDRHVGREVRAGRYGLPLLTAMLCACVAAFAIGTRLDVAPLVRMMDSGVTENGQPAELKTDRQLEEEVAKMTAVIRVKLGVDAVVMTPLAILGLGLGLLLLGRYVGGKPTMQRTLTVASLAAIPGAVKALMTAVLAWRQPQVFPQELEGLLKSPQYMGVDAFALWSVVIVMFGMCEAAELRPRKSIATIIVAFVLYVVVTRIIMGGAR
jgi:hypothetical protein